MTCKIIHLTSVHSRYDVRIFNKLCTSLAKTTNYDVTLVVADGLGNETKNIVSIVDVGCAKAGRLSRIVKTTRKIFKMSTELNGDIYHLHDPELIPIGLKLKRMGKKVIFDSHEDVPLQMLSKPYLNPFLLRVIANVLSVYERYACSKLDGIITATPFIRDKFLKINPNTIDVNNFPLIGELDSAVPWDNKQAEVCYVGGIAVIRGIKEVVRALGLLQSTVRLNLVGSFSEPATEAEVKAYPSWNKVNELGFLDRSGVRDALGRSAAGLVTFHPLPNHVDAQPNKMFEYMSTGIPVVASNFPLWREIIEGNDCGLCVDSLDPKTIAGAIDYLVRNPDVARRMGENGRKAVLKKYNWGVEETKLLKFYKDL